MIKIKTKPMPIIVKISYWVFFFFLAYLIFELIRKILGGSLGFEEMVIGLLVANLGYSFYLTNSMNRLDSKIMGHMGWHKGRENKD